MSTMTGFLGKKVGTLATVRDGDHTVSLSFFRFPDGTTEPYLEVAEDHPWYRGSRIVAVSTAVHLLLNVGDLEIYQIGNRETDWVGTTTTPGENAQEVA